MTISQEEWQDICNQRFSFDVIDRCELHIIPNPSGFNFGYLKVYYEIVDEAHPLPGFVPTHADSVTEMHI